MNPFEHTKTVAFELSNWCSHATHHDKCPLHLETMGPITLPSSIVLSCLEELGTEKYAGEICFHQYNEPLQDPRLFWFLDTALMVCPDAKPYIVTNGANLTRELCVDLDSLGVRHVVVSATDDAMRKRVELLRQVFGDWLVWSEGHVMDDRLLIYDVPKEPPEQPCYAPLRHVVITRDGEVGLCCFDWRRQYTFGDLREKSLSEILTSKQVLRLYEQLSMNRRELKLCGQCGRSR